MQSVHEGVKHNCELCEYKATQKGSLCQHEKSVHKGVKYNCDVCDYKAPTKDKLRNQVKSVHDGVKYDCDVPVCMFGAPHWWLVYYTNGLVLMGLIFPQLLLEASNLIKQSHLLIYWCFQLFIYFTVFADERTGEQVETLVRTAVSEWWNTKFL